MILLDILEIVISTYLKIRTSRLIANNDSLRMQLQGGNCPHLVHGALDLITGGGGTPEEVFGVESGRGGHGWRAEPRD